MIDSEYSVLVKGQRDSLRPDDRYFILFDHIISVITSTSYHHSQEGIGLYSKKTLFTKKIYLYMKQAELDM
jgi:hypothetical protein